MTEGIVSFITFFTLFSLPSQNFVTFSEEFISPSLEEYNDFKEYMNSSLLLGKIWKYLITNLFPLV